MAGTSDNMEDLFFKYMTLMESAILKESTAARRRVEKLLTLPGGGSVRNLVPFVRNTGGEYTSAVYRNSPAFRRETGNLNARIKRGKKINPEVVSAIDEIRSGRKEQRKTPLVRNPNIHQRLTNKWYPPAETSGVNTNTEAILFGELSPA